jgi:hypothetical protein
VTNDVQASMSAMAQLLYIFSQMGEAGQSFQRQDVEGRPDAEVRCIHQEDERKQRDQLMNVTLSGVVGRHAKVMQTFRTALISCQE